MNSIPQSEIDSFISSVTSHPEYLLPTHVINQFKSCDLNIIPNPFSRDLIRSILFSLKKKKALSVIRIGDGEANLLTYGVYSGTKNLDQGAAKEILEMQSDSFIADKTWMIILRELMMNAIAQADIVGVLGLWRGVTHSDIPERPPVEQYVKAFLSDHRGVSGQWRGIDYMLFLASCKYLKGKTITSAHLYFCILEYLDEILPLAKTIFVLSNRKDIMNKLARIYPTLHFSYIEVGDTKSSSNTLPDRPVFLERMFSALPQDMRGCLCLVGAGPWAEVYCTWVKQRGGVGIDIGSGFDLLDGEISRPIHRMVEPGRTEKYKLLR